MSSKLTFSIANNTGEFHFPAHASASFFSLLDDFMVERISEDEYIDELAVLIKQEPQCLDVIASLAACLAPYNPPQALAYANAGLKLTAEAIPDTFNGPIPWERPGNEAFYRLLHAAALANICNRNFDRARHLIKGSLIRNPTDPLGVRFLLNELPVENAQ